MSSSKDFCQSDLNPLERSSPKTVTFANNLDTGEVFGNYNRSTVNSEIFARTLFSRNFAYAKFRENKTLAKWQNHSVVY